MNIQAEKLKLIELLLNTDSETVLEKIKSVFKTAKKEKAVPARKNSKGTAGKNGNKPGFDFGWEGGLKGTEVNAVTLISQKALAEDWNSKEDEKWDEVL